MSTKTSTVKPGMILIDGFEFPAERREDGTVWYQNDESRQWKQATTAKLKRDFIPGYQPPLVVRTAPKNRMASTMNITAGQIVGAHKVIRFDGNWSKGRGEQVTAQKTSKRLGERVTVTRWLDRNGEVEFSHHSGDGTRADFQRFDHMVLSSATDAEIVAYINAKLSA